jgi:non-ribosomal peptide synthetase component F
VFTSGSTGKPKGAIVENRAFVTMAVPYARVIEIDTHSRVLHFASYAFDVSILEILGTLFAGACVCVLSKSERGEGLVDAVKTLQPSPLFARATLPTGQTTCVY